MLKRPRRSFSPPRTFSLPVPNGKRLLKLLDRNDPSLELYRNPAARELVTDFFTELVDSERIARAVLRYADREELSLFLAFSVAFVESDFNPKAVNRNVYSTDRGLFQLNSLSFPFLRKKSSSTPRSMRIMEYPTSGPAFPKERTILSR